MIKLEKTIAKQILKQFHDKTGVLGFFIIENQAHFFFFLTFGVSHIAYYISFLLLVEKSRQKQRGELEYIPDQTREGM